MTLTEAEVNEHSKAAWAALYAEVERLAGRHEPKVWGEFVAEQFKRCIIRRDLYRSRPPHLMLRSIEANAANWKAGRAYDFNENRFLKVMRVYATHNDPLHLSFAAKDLTAFFLSMNREQIELQITYNQFEIGRMWLIYGSTHHLTGSAAEMKSRIGITPIEWLQLCYLSFILTAAHSNSKVPIHWLSKYVKGGIDEKAVAAFAERVSWTVERLAKHYRKVRIDTPIQFHSFIRSAFLESPMMNYEDGLLLAPDPVLNIACMGAGLYRLLGKIWKSRPELREEFSVSVSHYIEQLLNQVRQKTSLSTDSQIERLSGGKGCDFILETENMLLLVESKSVAFERRLLFPEYMQHDSSTKQIIHAGEQLRATQDDIRNGLFDSIVTDRTKPMKFIIATYGDIPYANSEWYLRRVIIPSAESDESPLPSDTFGLSSSPVVMSLQVLEMFIVAVNSFNISPLDLFTEKADHDQLRMGVWGDFLRGKLNTIKSSLRAFDFIDRANEEFIATLSNPSKT